MPSLSVVNIAPQHSVHYEALGIRLMRQEHQTQRWSCIIATLDRVAACGRGERVKPASASAAASWPEITAALLDDRSKIDFNLLVRILGAASLNRFTEIGRLKAATAPSHQ
jgi:hypothetical protein